MNLKIALSTDLSLFDQPGYIKIDKEIIYYEQIITESSYYRFDNCSHAQFNSKSDWHDENTIVYALLFKSPQNPFTLLKAMLTLAGISASYIDTKFTTYESAWTDIDFSTIPIAKEINLNKIYFDLVNALDCMSWVGEDGKIKILKHSEVGTVPALTDEANIIFGSLSVDENESSRYTQWWQYYNRYDPEKSMTIKNRTTGQYNQ